MVNSSSLPDSAGSPCPSPESLPLGVIESDRVKLTILEGYVHLTMPHETGRLSVSLTVEEEERYGVPAVYSLYASTMPWEEHETSEVVSLPRTSSLATMRYALLGLIAGETNIPTC